MKVRAQRWPSDYPARLLAPGRKFSGHVVNISMRGARIAGVGAGFVAGDPVMLDLGALRVRATVRWTRPGLVGLGFDQRIGPFDLALIRQQALIEPGMIASAEPLDQPGRA